MQYSFCFPITFQTGSSSFYKFVDRFAAGTCHWNGAIGSRTIKAKAEKQGRRYSYRKICEPSLWLWCAFAAGTLLLAAVLFLPGLQILFEVTPLSGIEYATIFGLAISPTVVIQGYKFITSKKTKNLLK